MADKNHDNDEYEFADLDDLSHESTDEVDSPKSTTKYPSNVGNIVGKNVLRNALIVIGAIVLIMMIYKFTGSFFPKKNQVAKTSVSTPSNNQTAQLPIEPQPITPQPIEQPTEKTVAQAATTTTESATENASFNQNQFSQKLETVNLNQQTIRTDVNNINNQLENINATIKNFNEKIITLNQMVTTLSAKVEQQSNQMSLLIAKQTQQKTRSMPRRINASRTFYNIQAVIPGRAWLISTNGSTLTVREGTNIAGYGIVKLIDPNQGRVVTSSGRVIRFSQQDS